MRRRLLRLIDLWVATESVGLDDQEGDGWMSTPTADMLERGIMVMDVSFPANKYVR